MFLTVRFASLGKETLTFKVHLTCRAVETLRMPVLAESFDPTITRLNGKLTSIALGLKHCSPIFRTINLAVFIVKATGANRLVAVRTQEAVHVERILQCIDHFSNYSTSTFSTMWCKILFIVSFTKQLSSFFNKAAVDERHTQFGLAHTK
jgi:hypothetical protein